MKRLFISLLEKELGLTDGLYETFQALVIAALDPRIQACHNTAKKINIQPYLSPNAKTLQIIITI
jgi:hypothetical protein